MFQNVVNLLTLWTDHVRLLQRDLAAKPINQQNSVLTHVHRLWGKPEFVGKYDYYTVNIVHYTFSTG